MGASVSTSWKYCCTCEFWCGARLQSGSGNRVEYENRTAQGECLEGSWDWGGQKRTALSTCTGWKKWKVLPRIEAA